MNFQIGDSIDSNHCTALKHEFLRCIDSYEEFKLFAHQMSLEKKSNWLSYRAYNAYGDFILHLYAFMEGCLARELKATKLSNKKAYELTEKYITMHVNRILTNKRNEIIKGNENYDIDFYLKEILYQDSYSHWGKIGEEFPNLKEITDFSVLITSQV